MRKRILSLVLVFSVLIGCMPIIANAAEGTCGENLTWTLDDEGTLTISGEGEMADYYTSNNYAPWYDSRLSITNIIIKDGVTSIGDRAFMDCDNLISVGIPGSITNVGFIPFDDCPNLTGVYISDLAAWCNIEFHRYDSNPLYYAKNLYINNELAENITIPDGVEKIGDYTFYNCRSITDVNLSESVKDIGEWAFRFCTKLKSVNIPSGVKNIGEASFRSCIGLTIINIPDSVKNIGYCAFGNCVNLLAVEVNENNDCYMSEDGILFNKDKTNIICYPNKKSETAYEIPDSVTRIEGNAFAGCKILESVNIPESVNYIGIYAFEGCSNLTSLTIPEGVTEINYGMVLKCEKLASINIPESVNRISWNVFDGTAYYNDSSNWTDDVLYMDNCLIEAKKSLSGDYQIKDGTRVIAAVSLFNKKEVTGISIPDSVTNIGFSAFYGTAFYKDDSNWTDDVLYIDNCLIEAKNSLSGDYQIKDGTRLIAESAFFTSSNESRGITIPKSVTNINSEAFYDCNGNVNFIFASPTAPVLGEDVFPDKEFRIHIHEGYTGYTSANGYDESKIIIEPHNYTDGICSVCGAKDLTPKIERTDKADDTEYIFNITLEQEYENCFVYAAVYDESGALLAVKHIPLGTEDNIGISVNKSENDANAKVFVWSGNIYPIKAEEFIIKNDILE